MIKLVDPSFHDAELDRAIQTLKKGSLIQGETVELFEKELGSFIGVKHSLAVTSGTAALHLAMVALGIGQGDAVLVPAFTFPATSNVVEIVGAKTILVDVEEDTYCISPEALETAIENWDGPEKLKALIIVHEFGLSCRLDAIHDIARRHHLYIIEDAACALGTTFNERHIGGTGDVACFSFHPRKALTTGEGGLVVTNSDELHDKLNKLRNHGIERNPEGLDFVLPGFNYRLTEFQAALGLEQITSFKDALLRRKAIASMYLKAFVDLSIKLPRDYVGHAWQTFMIVLPFNSNRADIINQLRDQEVESNLGAQAIHLLKYYKDKYGFRREDYPVSAALYEKGLAIPIHGKMSDEDVYKVIDAMYHVLNKSR
ncbi:DegT/DnrJ/EryC1/StrS family aminotransferase [Paenibacillus sp. H1-7]|uniref:DegT/DnrJ/EryC1/StrS family aminotransferase n=1 Tax=Paenibacillus sp. H1-7 TaxID=2282849 RepID=UPI001EF93C7A|nr:DegT/DnrJ/EryC1/StrS family aminotransferase [Paenibacillus sp. H1-7]ULL19448.1 DegT/DnrJ/EryC1/StrS family aminotransferase [Paenibacillus sp. H1-7]